MMYMEDIGLAVISSMFRLLITETASCIIYSPLDFSFCYLVCDLTISSSLIADNKCDRTFMGLMSRPTFGAGGVFISVPNGFYTENDANDVADFWLGLTSRLSTWVMIGEMET